MWEQVCSRLVWLWYTASWSQAESLFCASGKWVGSLWGQHSILNFSVVPEPHIQKWRDGTVTNQLIHNLIAQKFLPWGEAVPVSHLMGRDLHCRTSKCQGPCKEENVLKRTAQSPETNSPANLFWNLPGQSTSSNLPPNISKSVLGVSWNDFNLSMGPHGPCRQCDSCPETLCLAESWYSVGQFMAGEINICSKIDKKQSVGYCPAQR